MGMEGTAYFVHDRRDRRWNDWHIHEYKSLYLSNVQ